VFLFARAIASINSSCAGGKVKSSVGAFALSLRIETRRDYNTSALAASLFASSLTTLP